MNIFVLDENPTTAAKMLCDCHLRKMCVETAQILSGVAISNHIELIKDMPSPQNIKHPVIKAVKTLQQINWVLYYNNALHLEYFERFGKKHAFDHLCYWYTYLMGNEFAPIDCTSLAKCCGDLEVADIDIVTAYRKYYTEIKKPQLQAKGLWKFTSREDWTNEQ